MKVSKIKVGLLRCNCYLLEKEDQCLLIDPGDDYEKIVEWIKEKKIIGVLLTHNHFDHVASADNLKEDFNYPIYSPKKLKEGNFKIGNFELEVIQTNGHTMDSFTFYFKEEKMMFTGDFLFKGTIGRCDLLESDYTTMLKSIQKIKKYPSDTIIYPGHGLPTTLEEEKKHNPYF